MVPNTLSRIALISLVALIQVSWGAVAGAQKSSRAVYLLRLLRSAKSFRVRAQAALTLSKYQSTTLVRRALADALEDPHPAVRASAANALERLGDASAVSRLEMSARSDGDARARRSKQRAAKKLAAASRRSTTLAENPGVLKGTKYFIHVGDISSSHLNASLAREIRQHISTQVRAIPGALVSEAPKTSNSVSSLLQTKGVDAYYLRNSLLKLLTQPGGQVRAEVSIVVLSFPDHAMRMVLSGAATVSGAGTGDEAKMAAVASAFKSALKRLEPALASVSRSTGGLTTHAVDSAGASIARAKHALPPRSLTGLHVTQLVPSSRLVLQPKTA